jgi:small subunit ribosomal protein S1
MDNENAKSTENVSQIEMQEEYIKSFKPIQEGELVNGQIIEIDSEYVFIDVGYKSEGKIPLQEFKTQPKIGDDVPVVIIKKEGREGSVVVSKKQADEKVFWLDLKKAFEEKIPMEGKIVKSIKGGFEVDLGFDIRAFMPLSKADIYRVENPDELVGLKSYFIVERLYSDSKVNIILSRKSFLETENKRKKDDFFDSAKIGDEVEGIVKSFTSFGAFIDIGGFDGLLHINDMSWGHVTKPKDIIQKGDKITLKVIKIDRAEERINLSLKHFHDDPWLSFEEKYNSGDIVKGKVTKLAKFGVFIELEEGIEGLAHISELSWVKKVRDPKEIVSEGDEVEVKILSYDLQKGKVSLGLKQVYPNPWDDLAKRYPVGMRITRTVKNLSSFGAFFEIEEGIDGLLHIEDFSWTKKYKAPSDLLNPGDDIEVMIIDIDKENKKIKLGLKQLSEDPWQSLMKAFPTGSIIEGEISSIEEFGILVKVQGNIEGLINQGNLFDPKVETYEQAVSKYKPGDKIKAVVSDIKPSRQKLALSIREYNRKIEKEEIAKYIHDDSNEDKVTFAAFLKNNSDQDE